MKKNNSDIVLSIVIPALNEEITIGRFIEWCNEGISKIGVKSEIIIIDSSLDKTPNIAKKMGATVIRTPKRGLGRAYIDSLPYINGKYVLMGDCDLTYDFRRLKEFISAFNDGYEYIMGSRFKGYIEPGAMPYLHRYFGTPLTTFILNFIYKTKFSDIHCGMRGITKEALLRIKLTSQGWEYASEMVVKAARYKLKCTEVPVYFYKDVDGRLSHHVRSGFWSPWRAGWDNLKVMFIYTPDSFLIKPSYLIFLFGLLFLFNSKNVFLLDIEYSASLTLGLMLILISIFMFIIGIFFRCIHSLRNGIENKIINFFPYNRGMLISIFLFTICLFLSFNFFTETFAFSVHYIVPIFLFFLSLMFFVLTVGIELIMKINEK